MKKLVTLGVVAVLALGLIGPADAKKKKKKKPAAAPVEVQYFLRMDEDCDAPFLSLTDGEETSDCFFAVDDMFNEYPQAQAAFGDPVDRYVAADGLPLTLDTSRTVTGSFTVRGWSGVGGVGLAEVDVTLVATIAGEEKEIGTFNHSYTAGPLHEEEIAFEMTLDPALAGVEVEGLTLGVHTHGNVVLGRGIEHDSDVPPSVKIPALK
ncbi:MAG: hypothetical protein M3323_04230 [Actinomycetota bacterium]|nr:hypothetical protein [Actinomycetota bacterium]